MRIPKSTLQYLAGIVDGEGCICIERTKGRKKGHTLRHVISLGVEMADREPLFLFKRWLGGYFKSRKRKSHYKRQYTWKIAARKAVVALRAILPYLRIKRKIKAARLCLALATSKKYQGRGQGVRVPAKIIARRERLHRQCRRLNRRG